jgi:hypothetical protein
MDCVWKGEAYRRIVSSCGQASGGASKWWVGLTSGVDGKEVLAVFLADVEDGAASRVFFKM